MPLAFGAQNMKQCICTLYRKKTKAIDIVSVVLSFVPCVVLHKMYEINFSFDSFLNMFLSPLYQLCSVLHPPKTYLATVFHLIVSVKV